MTSIRMAIQRQACLLDFNTIATSSGLSRNTLSYFQLGAVRYASQASSSSRGAISNWDHQGIRFSNQVERAVRLKSMKKRREKYGAKWSNDKQKPVVRSKLRKIRHDAVNSLHELLLTKEIDQIEGYEQAERLVKDLTPLQRRDPRIYTTLIRHALRVQKVNRALKILQEQKKNGVAPSMPAYFSIFHNVALMKIDVNTHTCIVDEVKSLFSQVEEYWRLAHDKDREGYMSKEKRRENEANKAKTTAARNMELKVMSAATSYKATTQDIYDVLLEKPEVYTKVCGSYVEFLLSVDMKQDAARIMLRLQKLAAPLKRDEVKDSELRRRLAEIYLQAHDVKIERKWTMEDAKVKKTASKKELAKMEAEDKVIIAKAQRLAAKVLVEAQTQVSANSTTKDADERREHTLLAKGVQGAKPLALTKHDLHEMLGG